MTILVTQLVVWLIIGAVAGWLATMLLKGRSMGQIMNILLGVLGAVVGGILFSALHITQLNFLDIKISLLDIIEAFIGAVIVLLVVGEVMHRRK
jgi:uncharacterized membrane protein YeaQ/YmgE (transglycosylase-associated protein family)